MVLLADKLYNGTVKTEFLNGYEDLGTRADFQRVLAKAKKAEQTAGKDLYNFNLLEIESVMYAMKPKSVLAVIKIKRVISVYIDWAIKKTYRLDRNNPLIYLDDEWYNKFAKGVSNLYFTRDKFFEVYLAGCVNPQDRAIIHMLFEGVNGNSEYDEIRNLRKSDVDAENQLLTLTNDDGQVRQLKVSKELIEIIQAASEQTMYRKRNGHITITSKHASGLNQFTELVDNDFVIRNSDTGTTAYSVCVNAQAVYRRIKTIAETLNINEFTAKNIQFSGMIWLARKLYKEQGELSSKQYEEIVKRFNLKDRWHYIKKIVNLDTINELYGEG